MSEPTTPKEYRMDMSGVLGELALFGVCLLVAFLARGRWWGYIGHGLYLLLLGFVYWSAFSRAEYEKARKKECPDLTHSQYARMTLLLYGLLPTLGWFGLMLPMLLYTLGRH